MSDCKYPHRVTVCLTDEAFQKLQKEIFINHRMGGFGPSISNLILANVLAKIESQDVHPVWLGVEDIRKDTPTQTVRKTIVPCKECHEHPCTC